MIAPAKLKRGTLGGRACAARHGPDHYRRMAERRIELHGCAYRPPVADAELARRIAIASRLKRQWHGLSIDCDEFDRICAEGGAP